MSLQKLVNPSQDYGYHSSEGTTLRYKKGSEWIVVPGVSDYNVSGTEATSRDVIVTNINPTKRVTRPRAGMVTFNSLYMPTDRAWREIRDANINRDLLTWRLDLDGDLVWESDATNGCTATVAVDGEVTFTAGTGQAVPTFDSYPIGRGGLIHFDDSDGSDTPATFIINGVGFDNTGAKDGSGANSRTDVTSTLFVLDVANHSNPSDAVTAKLAQVYSPPPARYEFTANVLNVQDSNMPSEGELDTTLILQLRGPWPNPTIVTDVL